MDYLEHTDYELIQSTNPEFNKALVRINITRDHRQTIQYIHPSDAAKLGQAELVVIDEAAAIPLPLVKELISGPYLVFLASTINGYEGTGRSLSLKLLQQLREQSSGAAKKNEKGQQKLATATARTLHELVLEESIRYKPGDHVEQWLSRILCLDATNIHRLISGTPPPKDCELYYVNRDTLFSFHKGSEQFLRNMMAIYVSAHYKNTPNDLQMLSDAPAHHLFVLMGPVRDEQTHLPEILAVVQVCLEGALAKTSVSNNLERGRRAAGDLLPWTISQQFLDNDFPTLSGARIVRIAVHPDYQSMGYGSRALELLVQYYSGEISSLSETAPGPSTSKIRSVEDDKIGLLEEQVIPRPREDLPPLLHRLTERPAERLDYVGTSFGLTLNLLKFWKRASFVPVYLRQTTNDLTGEYTCIMLRSLAADEDGDSPSKSHWLAAYWREFRTRLISLLGFEFSKFSPHLAISLLQLKSPAVEKQLVRQAYSRSELEMFLVNTDLKRIAQYARNMIDHHLITDLLPTVAKLYFNEKISEDVKINIVQSAILLGLGLQHKTVDDLVKELEMPANQVLALFSKTMRRFSDHFDSLCMNALEGQIVKKKETNTSSGGGPEMEAMPMSLEEDLREAEEDIKRRQKRDRAKLEKELGTSFKEYAIKGSDEQWANALSTVKLDHAKSSIISVQSNVTPSKDTTGDFKSPAPAKKNLKRKRKSGGKK
uniref:RNA cytidine acetyltransferase n=1 Tax=Steinernema glaseri TaxID=37863 RepID=A0A1I7Y929_9BILA